MRTFEILKKDKLIKDIETHIKKLIAEFDQTRGGEQQSLARNTPEKLDELFFNLINELEVTLRNQRWIVPTLYAGVSYADEIALKKELIVILTKYSFLKELESKINSDKVIPTADELGFVGKDKLEEKNPLGKKPLEIVFQATFSSRTQKLYEQAARLSNPNAAEEMSRNSFCLTPSR